MKRKVFGILCIVTFAVVGAFNVSIGLRNDSLSDLTLANIEALSQSEDGSYSCCSPYTERCSVEGGSPVPGVKKSLGGC